MSRSADQPFASTKENKPNSSDLMFTRVIPPPGKCLTNVVGRDSGLGSTFGATSSDPASISVVEHLPVLSQTEPPSMSEAIEGSESGSSRCSSVMSQQTVRAVQPSMQPSIAAPPTLTRTHEQIPCTEREALSSNSTQLENAMKLSMATKQSSMSSIEQSPYEPNQFSMSNVCHSEISFPSGEQNLITNEILYMADSRVPAYESSCSSPVGHPMHEVPESKDSGSSDLNSIGYASAAPSDDDLDNIVINPWEYKEEFREKQYDIVLIYSENDRNQALTFRDILTKFITMEDNNHPSICVLDQNVNLTYINSRFTHMEEALKRSTFMFLFITKDFCGDGWAQLQRDECLMESVDNHLKKWCVIPILTKPRKEADYTLPFGLRALKGVEIYQMLCGKTLQSVNVSTLQECEVDQYFCNNMRKMLSTRLGLKIQREKQQLIEFQKWLKEEKQRRWKTAQKEQLENYLNERRRAEERAKFQEKLDARKQQEIAMIEAPLNETAEDDVIMDSTRMKENVDYHPINIETKSLISKRLMDESATVHHHHYYGSVKQTSDKHTVYNISAPIIKSTIGDNNELYTESEEKSGVVLEQTYLETDETDTQEDSIEYVVEVEENAYSDQPDIQQGEFGNCPVIGTVEAFRSDYTHRMSPVDETISTVDQISPSPEASSLANPMYQKKNEVNSGECRLIESANCSPEVDNPQSPPCENAKRSVQPGFDFAKNEKSTNTAANLSPLVANMLDAGASSSKPLNTLRSFSNESSSGRPVVVVAPIRQVSETATKTNAEETTVQLPFNEEEDDVETEVKSRFRNEESKLKPAKMMLRYDEEEKDEETAVKSQFCNKDVKTEQTHSTNIIEASKKQEVNSGNRSCLPGTSSETVGEPFVVVEKNELPGSSNASKKMVQTDGTSKVKSLITNEQCTEHMTMSEKIVDTDKSDGNDTSVGPNTRSLSNSSSFSASSSPSTPKNKCILS